MRRRRHWGVRRRAWRRRGILLAAGLLLAAFFAVLQIQMRPIIIAIAAQDAHLEVVRIINDAVSDQLGRGVAYQQLVHVFTDSSGKVSYIQPDTVKITRLTTAIATDIEENINNLEDEGICFPAGLLTGYMLLANKGPQLTIGITPVGDVEVDIGDEFIEAGINQTKHRIVLNISATLGLFIPFSEELVQVDNSLPLTENIIVGPIPNTLLDMEGQNTLKGLSGLDDSGYKEGAESPVE